MNRARWWVVLGLATPVVLPVALYGLVYARYHFDPPTVLTVQQQHAVVKRIRGALGGRTDAAEQLSDAALPGPLWTTLYERGEVLFRHRSQQPRLTAALAETVAALRQAPATRAISAKRLARTRIKVDVYLGRAPVNTWFPHLFTKSLVPGVDGLGLQTSEATGYLLPDDLYRFEWLAAGQPFFFMEEFRTGLDTQRAVDALADQLQLSLAAWRRTAKRFFRFRLQSFVESYAQDSALGVTRCRVPIRGLGARGLREAATRAADYVLRQMRPDGRFHYIYYPLRDQHGMGSDYNMPRHAGTTWFLSLAYRHLGDPRYRDTARRAAQYLAAHAIAPACSKTEFACVGSDSYAGLGSSALTIVALAEYQRATGDKQMEPLMRRLGRFVLRMQKPSGSFCHYYRPDKHRKDCESVTLYYSGEAALALAQLHSVTGDTHLIAPLKRALDYLVGPKYEFFLGQFFISEDHWTCIAAEAAWPALKDPAYLRFCREFAALNRRAQVGPGFGSMDDLQGSFVITPFFAPHNTPVGSRTEANVATYRLAQSWGESAELTRDTIRDALGYLVDQQFRPDSSYLFANPVAAEGGMPQTPLRTEVRIDYVQHAGAAMLRALDLW